MKKIYILLILLLIIFTGCSTEKDTLQNDKLNVVTTIFPPYDFVKEIGKDKVNASILLKPGQESHTFEPTPKDIKNIQNSDLFIYIGGENDFWVDEILNNMGDKKPNTLKLIDYVSVLNEEIVEGMEHEHDDDDDEHLIDEHIWTSPKNSILIVEKISQILSKESPNDSNFFENNSKEYIKNLNELDRQIRDVVSNSKRNTIVFGDRFPFRYLADEYGINYYAAFSGCSTETEASPKTITFLINKVKDESIPIVFIKEFSNGKIADSIIDSTNSKKQTLNSIHNLSDEQIKNGESYLSLMQQNVNLLKEALN